MTLTVADLEWVDPAEPSWATDRPVTELLISENGTVLYRRPSQFKSKTLELLKT